MFKKIEKIAFVFFGLSFLCGLVYSIKGQTITPDGVLHEAFALIPLSYLFTFIGFALMVISMIKRIKDR